MVAVVIVVGIVAAQLCYTVYTAGRMVNYTVMISSFGSTRTSITYSACPRDVLLESVSFPDHRSLKGRGWVEWKTYQEVHLCHMLVLFAKHRMSVLSCTCGANDTYAVGDTSLLRELK